MNFDRLAPFYRITECVCAGPVLQHCRVEFLAGIPRPAKVLLVGEGHGRFLPVLLSRFPGAEVFVLDSSAAMLRIARSHAGNASVKFVHADVRDWIPDENNYDLIATHFVLDCFTEEQMPALIGKLAGLAAPGAHWLIADFRIPDQGLSRLRARFIVAALYRFFRFTTALEADSLPSPDAHLIRAGFSLHRQSTRSCGLLKSEWWRRKPKDFPAD